MTVLEIIKRGPTVLEIIKQTAWVEFECCDGQNLWYTCNASGMPSFFRFPIPLVDTAGGMFLAQDHKPLHFMRWIRKQVAALATEAEEIELARKEWKP